VKVNLSCQCGGSEMSFEGLFHGKLKFKVLELRLFRHSAMIRVSQPDSKGTAGGPGGGPQAGGRMPVILPTVTLTVPGSKSVGPESLVRRWT
jgi:hypothetical protein